MQIFQQKHRCPTHVEVNVLEPRDEGVDVRLERLWV